MRLTTFTQPNAHACALVRFDATTVPYAPCVNRSIRPSHREQTVQAVGRNGRVGSRSGWTAASVATGLIEASQAAVPLEIVLPLGASIRLESAGLRMTWNPTFTVILAAITPGAIDGAVLHSAFQHCRGQARRFRAAEQTTTRNYAADCA